MDETIGLIIYFSGVVTTVFIMGVLCKLGIVNIDNDPFENSIFSALVSMLWPIVPVIYLLYKGYQAFDFICLFIANRINNKPNSLQKVALAKEYDESQKERFDAL